MLDCLRELTNPLSLIDSYTLKNFTWQIEGFNSSADFMITEGNLGIVRKDKLGTNLRPGYSTNITVSAILSNGTLIKGKTLFAILKSPLSV